MKISSITTNSPKPVFTGREKILSKGYYDNSVTVAEGPFPYCTKGDYTKLVKENSYPDAEVERTLGSYHSNPTGKIYVADPLEYIDDSKRTKYDYIVYDKEPKYPKAEGEISENYFGTKRVDYDKKFRNIRDYYNRLEMSDRNTSEEYRRRILANYNLNDSKEKFDYYNDRIAKSQYQQEQAEHCRQIYNKAGHLRWLKETSEDMIVSQYKYIENLNKTYEDKKIELNKAIEAKKQAATEAEIMSTKYKAYNTVQSANHRLINGVKCSDWLKPDQTEVKDVEKRIKITNDRMQKLSDVISGLVKTIDNCREFIDNYPATVQRIKDEIAGNELKIKDIKAKLIPLFDELKHYYAAKRILG